MLDRHGLQDRYAFVQELAREAGELAYDYYKRRAELAIESKGLQDVVSIADKKVEELIRGKLEARFPEDGFLGEETGASQGGAAGQAGWVVDRIDGTSCFLGGMPTDRKSVGSGTRVSVRVNSGCHRRINKKKQRIKTIRSL